MGEKMSLVKYAEDELDRIGMSDDGAQTEEGFV